MPTIFYSLAILACPVGMGLMMWFMMRGNQAGTSNQPEDTGPLRAVGSPPPGVVGDAATTPLPTRPAENGSMPAPGQDARPTFRWPPVLRLGGLCFNPKVLAGLAFVGLGIWVAAPQFVGAAVPILLVAACPLSMLWMMQGMRGGQRAPGAAPGMPMEAGRNAADDLVSLQRQLSRTQTEQAALQRAIARLEAAPPSRSPAPPPGVRDSESVAPSRSADERVHAQV